MILRKAWALANDVWYMPATFFSFFGQNMVDNYTTKGNEALKHCPNPKGISRFFNDVALGAAAISGVYAVGGSDAGLTTQLAAGATMVGAMMTGLAVNFVVWGHGMVLRDKWLAKELDRPRRIAGSISGYMFPRLRELKTPEPPQA